jgi:hypothetical protein
MARAGVTFGAFRACRPDASLKVPKNAASSRRGNRNLPSAEVSQATVPRIRLISTALLAFALLAGAVSTSPALASHNEGVYFEGSTVLLKASTRERAIAQLRHLGVSALRVELYWVDVAPSPKSAKRPHFDASNPASYRWGGYDWLLRKAAELHWPVLLTLTGPAPKWATSTHRDYVTRPNDLLFQQFATAVGRRYGSLVSLYAIWNEPNHPDYLMPQFVHRSAASPRIYRGLFQAGYAGLRAAGIAQPKVLLGETAPSGTPRVVSPLAFLRGTLCLDGHYRKSRTCGPLPAYAYAHHAYTKPAGPFYVPPREDVMIGVLSRLSRALDLAAGAHAIKPHMMIYLTEFGVQSKPNRFLGVPVGKQAEYDAIAEHIAWSNPRVAAFSQYLLRDDPLGGRPGSAVIGFQTGLEYVNGKPKPLYYSWPLQLTVAKHGRGVSLWGLVRPTVGSTKLTVQVQPKGSRGYRTLATVTTDGLGYWSLRSSTAGAHWRVLWTSPSGARYQGPPIGAY